MDSKTNPKKVTMKEKLLGHMIGPLGLIFVVNTIAALLETFVLKQMAVFQETDPALYVKMGGMYATIAAITKIGSTLMGIATGWIMQHTKSRQGRIRPWHLIFGIVAIISGFLLFLMPFDSASTAYWVYFYAFFVVYNIIGCSFYYIFNNNIVSLSTRNFDERASIQWFRKIGWTLISGTIIGMVINSVLLPFWLEKDIRAFWYLICIMCVLAVPLLFMEYFYTRERVVEDITDAARGKNINAIPLKEQFKALFTNKYYILMFIAGTLGMAVDTFRGGNVQYWYLRFVLDGVNNDYIYMIYQVVTGVPLGIGAFIIYPLSKKFGIRNVSMVGFSLVALGSIIGLVDPSNMTIAFASGFIKQLGYIPNAYVLATLIGASFDSVEHKSGYRLEGLMAVGILVALQNIVAAPFAGIYERVLTVSGFNANAMTQPVAATNFLSTAFYGIELFIAVVWLIVLSFIDLEKQMPKINADLKERHAKEKQKALDE